MRGFLNVKMRCIFIDEVEKVLIIQSHKRNPAFTPTV